MSSAIERIHAIQRGYLEIVREILQPCDWPDLGDQSIEPIRLFCATRMMDEHTAIPVRGGAIPRFEDRLNKIAHQVYEYWEEYGDELGVLLAQVPSCRIATSVSGLFDSNFRSSVQRLCLYFDTLVVTCPIHEGKSRIRERYTPVLLDQDERKSKMHIAENLINVVLIGDLLTADAARPIVVVVPDRFSSSDSAQKTDLYTNRLVLKHLAGIDFFGPKGRRWPDAFRRRVKSDANLDSLFNEIVMAAAGGNLPSALKVDERFLSSFNNKAFLFVDSVTDAVYAFNALAVAGDAFAADPLLPQKHQRIFSQYQDVAVSAAVRRYDMGLSENIVSRALLSEKMGFLEAVSVPHLRALRSDGKLELLRERLRYERERYKNGSYAHVDGLANGFAESFINAIKEEASVHLDKEGAVRSEIRKSVIYFAGSCAFGAATVALPQTLMLNALGLAFTAGVGGASIKDVVAAIKAGHDARARFRNNPFNIFYNALNRSG